jgi:membrane protein
MKALFDALNIIHDETEKRSFIRLNAVSLVFTLGLVLFFVVAVGAIVVLPAVLTRLGMGDSTQGMLLTLARWPMLFLAISLVLSLIDRSAAAAPRPPPDGSSPPWHSPGTRPISAISTRPTGPSAPPSDS